MSDAGTGIDLKRAFPDDALTMEHLAEEAAEVIQMKSKVIRFGLEDEWPKESGQTNRKKLVEELGHLLAVIDVLKARGIVTQEEMDVHKWQKWDGMTKWNAYRGTKGEL